MCALETRGKLASAVTAIKQRHRGFRRARIGRIVVQGTPFSRMCGAPQSLASGNMLTRMRSAAHRELLSARMKQAWNDPEKRARILAGQWRAASDPAIRARVSAGVARSWQNPVVRDRRCAANKKASADPDLRSRRAAALRKTLASPEARARKSAAMKKVWGELKARARLAPRFCGPHQERTGQRVPAAHFVGTAFCRACFGGEALSAPTSKTSG